METNDVLKEIELAQREGRRELSLKAQQLDVLPNNIGQLINLEELDVGNNQLTVLPDSLGQLVKLKALNVSNNGCISTSCGRR